MNSCPHCHQKHAAANHFCPVTGLPIALGPRLLSTKLLDKYTVLRIVGEGPIGIVLEVEDNFTKQHYAAKLIHPQFTRDATAAKNFLDDAVRVQALSSENLAKIVQVGRDAGAAIVVIREFMVGECLAAKISKSGRFDMKEAVAVTREILTALTEIHKAGVINLDLSPADIFLAITKNGTRPKMVDIGERHIKQSIPADAAPPESYNYYAPEQLDRSRQPNLRSDIYAAGMILYEMLTGVYAGAAPSSPESVRPEIPIDLAQATMKAVAATPNNRFQSTAEFNHALETIRWDTPSTAAKAAVTPAVSAAPAPPTVAAAPTGTVGQPPESETASVIVEMPEIQKKPPVKWILLVGILLLLAGGIAWHLLAKEGTLFSSDEPKIPTVQITIDVTPPDAVVYADGKRIGGRPPVLTAPMDTALHTIAGKANGFESIERDVSFDRSKSVKLELMEIIQPDDPAPDEPTPQENPSEPLITPVENGVVAPTETKPVQESPSAAAPEAEKKTSGNSRAAQKTGTRREKSSAEKPRKQKKSSAEKASKSSKPARTKSSSSRSKNLEGFRTTNPFE